MNRAAVTMVPMQPVIWIALGYQFEAASMLAGLSACFFTRVWVSLKDVPSNLLAWSIDVTVTIITLLFTAGWVASQRPEPFYALLGGTGFGVLGAGLIPIAISWVGRSSLFGIIKDRDHG